MNHPQRSQSQVSLKHLRDLLVLYTPLWLGAAIGFGALGATYSLLRTDHYLARQPLVVRDEANSAVDRMGRFASASALRAAQETVLDIAHNRTVVAAAMCEIGPPNENAPADWPTVTDVDDAINRLESMEASLLSAAKIEQDFQDTFQDSDDAERQVLPLDEAFAAISLDMQQREEEDAARDANPTISKASVSG